MNTRWLTDGEVLCFISPLRLSDHLKHCVKKIPGKSSRRSIINKKCLVKERKEGALVIGARHLLSLFKESYPYAFRNESSLN